MANPNPDPVNRLRGARLLLIVGMIPVVVVVVGGLGSTILQSIGLMPLVGPVRLSVDAYVSTAPALLSSIGTSLWIAAASTAVAIVLGATTAFVVVSGGRLGRIVGAIGAVTVSVPHLIGAATMGLLLADSGVLPRLLGIDATAWPALVAGPWWVAVIAEYAWKESAFIALVVAGTLLTRVAQFDEPAAMLGASRGARLRMVFLPLAAPALIVSATIVFIYTLGSYEVAWLLGRTYPEPLAVMAIRLFNDVSLSSRTESAAIAVLTVAISLAAVAVAAVAMRRSAVWR
ncbi:ABC transporter permease subunit [Salinibacterium sp. G-O1]|uniref:ABC transporter permease n=1 Tax=Salinibacterium sp. G-O1 TaxID=3046208 RepID=UPI0024B9F8BD|nr:ABC transporter permease subunit [Salinibacterium sp. G-O1]MDJ0336134.1 ABC transporter permease subunit [Salinibacterium sp. G-O1]